MNRELGEIVRKSSLFHDTPAAVLEQAMTMGVLRPVESGGFFFLQGDQATHAYVLVTGLVKMLQITADGSQILLRIMTSGQTFGGIAMLNPRAGYPATAQAAENSSAMAWSTADLRQLAGQDQAIALNTMQLMHGYIRELQQRQTALLTGRAEQRIARVLLKLATESGREVTDGMLIALPLSRQDIADMSGTTLYTVSRTIKEWDRKGYLKAGRGKITLLQPHVLVRLADELID